MNAVEARTGDRVLSAIAVVSRSIDGGLTETSEEDHERQRDEDTVHDDLPYRSVALFHLFDIGQLVHILLISTD